MPAGAKRSKCAGAVSALAAALSLVVAPGSPRAEPARTSSLGWTRLPGAEACSGARELALDVEARLGHAVFVAPSTAELTLEGRVEVAPAPSTFRATIRLLDRQGALLGTRELETADPTCRDLADPLGLAIALMIDPEAAALEPAPAAAPAPARRAEGVVPWVGAPRLDEPGGAEPSDDVAQPWAFMADGGVTIAAGVLPRVATGARLRLLLDPDGFPGVEAGATHFPAVVRSGSYSLSYGSFGVCPWTPDFTVIEVATCAGAHIGAFTATGTLGSRTDFLVLPYAKAGVVRRVVGPVAATLDLGVAFPTNNHRYAYGLEPFRMSPVSGTLDLGLGVEVP